MGTTSFSGPVESVGGFTVGGVPVQGGQTAAQMTVSGPVTTGARVVELNHATVAIAATMPQGPAGFFAVVNTSASGTAAHTITLTTGSWNGTNRVLTTNAPAESCLIYFDTAGRGTVIYNGLTSGTNVAFSG
jgi:hypothetical protein